MRIIAGDTGSLIGLVRKRVKDSVEELEDSLERETDERVGRAKSQAKQLRDLILEKAGKDAEAMRKEKLMEAQQEAKQMMIRVRGRMENSILEEIRAELVEFVNGKNKIGAVSYDSLVKKALEQGKKRQVEFKIAKHDDGVVLTAPSKELDLRVDSLLSLLPALEVKMDR